MEELLRKLKENFGLDDKHIFILKILSNENLNAKQICHKAKIPQGRIYDYLNFLIENNLVERTHKKPFKYSVGDLNEKVMGFMKRKVDNLVEAQSDVIDIMSGAAMNYFERITDSKKFTQVHLSMITEAKKTFNYISLHTSFPYVMYPFERDSFVKLRQAIVKNRPTITSFDPNVALLIRKTYLEAFEKGKDITVVFEKKSFDFHVKVIKKLGKKFLDEWKKSISEQFEKYNLKAFVLDEYLPMQIDVNERKVNNSLRHHNIIN